MVVCCEQVSCANLMQAMTFDCRPSTSSTRSHEPTDRHFVDRCSAFRQPSSPTTTDDSRSPSARLCRHRRSVNPTRFGITHRSRYVIDGCWWWRGNVGSVFDCAPPSRGAAYRRRTTVRLWSVGRTWSHAAQKRPANNRPVSGILNMVDVWNV